MIINPTHSTLAKSVGAPEESRNNPQPESAKSSLNAAIVNLSVEVNVGVKEQPMELLYQSAVTQINELLEPTFGPSSLQKALESGLDVSPEATADRIVNLATGFYAAYQSQHQGEDPEQVLENFVDTIKGGIERGFQEAREVLSGLGVLEGDIATNIDRTYDLVQDGVAGFAESVSRG